MGGNAYVLVMPGFFMHQRRKLRKHQAYPYSAPWPAHSITMSTVVRELYLSSLHVAPPISRVEVGLVFVKSTAITVSPYSVTSRLNREEDPERAPLWVQKPVWLDRTATPRP